MSCSTEFHLKWIGMHIEEIKLGWQIGDRIATLIIGLWFSRLQSWSQDISRVSFQSLALGLCLEALRLDLSLGLETLSRSLDLGLEHQR